MPQWEIICHAFANSITYLENEKGFIDLKKKKLLSRKLKGAWDLIFIAI